MPQHSKKIVTSRHPSFLTDHVDWTKWRLTMDGGEDFRLQYLQKFSNREDRTDFVRRRDMTPIPSFARAAVTDIRNALFGRLVDVTRKGGSTQYQDAVAGETGGVDQRGSTMNSFLGQKVIDELLVMGKVGVFVDMPQIFGPTLADVTGRPYLYTYPREFILNWKCAGPEKPGEFQSLLLQDVCERHDDRTGLPTETFIRFRMLWIDQETGFVNVQFFNEDDEPVGLDNEPRTEPYVLNLRRIPFVMLDIGDSLVKHVADHQVALLNLVSSDVNYAIQSNFPFYIEQADLRGGGDHLKPVQHNGSGDQSAAANKEMKIGATQGRQYGINVPNAPQFIHPSPDPLKVSMDLQKKLEADIRRLVNLAVETMATRASAESKQLDNQGLDAGLNFIGLILEQGEREIANHWAAYENERQDRREVAVISYPDRYSLKTDAQRIEEAQELSDLIFKVPGKRAKREIYKEIVKSLLGGKLKAHQMEAILLEIDNAPYTTSDPEIIIKAKEAGLVGDEVASQALGFNVGEHIQAQLDHAARLARLTEAQQNDDQGARGNPDGSADAGSGSRERELSRNTDTRESTQDPVRGEGQ